MFLNDNQYFYVYIYIGEMPKGRYMSHTCKSIPKNSANFFSFKMYIVTNKL